MAVVLHALFENILPYMYDYKRVCVNRSAISDKLACLSQLNRGRLEL